MKVLETTFVKTAISSFSRTLTLFLSCPHSNNPTHKYFLAVDPVSGALFISDTNSRRIYRVRSLTGGRLLSDNAEVVAGTGEQCLPFDERCGDGGKATEATLMSPKGESLRGSAMRPVGPVNYIFSHDYRGTITFIFFF